MDIEYFNNSFNTEDGTIELIVADNMCSTFVYPELLLKHYPSLNCIRKEEINKILDVGCGAGPFCIYYGLQGKRIDGLDINPIAVECCRRNIEKYGLNKNVRVMLEGIQNFETDERYDLIICNPPLGDYSYMRHDACYDRETINSRLKSGIIDAMTEDFLTNCWRDASGKDMVDYIFEKSMSLLRQNGKILIVCGDDFIDGASYICQKASLYSNLRVIFNKKYTEHLYMEDINEVFECDKNYNVLVLENGK